eukprot:136062_1
MACSDIMGCCGGKNEETEEINLLDLESGVVDVAKGDGTLDSEILGYEQSVENSLHVSSGHRNHLIIGVVALLAIAALIFAMYKYGFIYPTAYVCCIYMRFQWEKRVYNMLGKLSRIPREEETVEELNELLEALEHSGVRIEDWKNDLIKARDRNPFAH